MDDLHLGCPQLLDIYHNYDDLVILILELFVEIAHKQPCYLKKVSSSQLLKSNLFYNITLIFSWSML